jgi:hypothetical protein
MNRTAVVSGASTILVAPPAFHSSHPNPNLAIPCAPSALPFLCAQHDDDAAGIGGALGAAIACRLAQDGYRVVGLARNLQVLTPAFSMQPNIHAVEEGRC